jgi:hypothetical protein
LAHGVAHLHIPGHIGKRRRKPSKQAAFKLPQLREGKMQFFPICEMIRETGGIADMGSPSLRYGRNLRITSSA